MGRLIKNHLARLIVLAASAYQILAAIEGYIWPKIFWDFWTANLNGAVSPAPILQTINLVLGLAGLALEWPLGLVAGTAPHASIELRLMLYPLSATAAAIMYQSTNAAVFLIVGCVVYFWAYIDGEVVCEEPWSLPRKAPARPPPPEKNISPV